VDTRPLIDAEYNLVFVATEYFGYLRRDGDANGLNFWLVEQVNRFPLPEYRHPARHGLFVYHLNRVSTEVRFRCDAQQRRLPTVSLRAQAFLPGAQASRLHWRLDI
jgi:hypothetical protein